MAVPNNVANLVIGENLYKVDSQITDFRGNGSQLRELETEHPDMSKAVSQLGTATCGGNSINNLQIDGDPLTPAKNKSFVDTTTDQSITGQKSFRTTTQSVYIAYSDYDNSNVNLAGGRVRSIADSQSASYSKSQDDALLAIKLNISDQTFIQPSTMVPSNDKIDVGPYVNGVVNAYFNLMNCAIYIQEGIVQHLDQWKRL
ncbi:MAG: hypothetical protein EZS28_023072 [Streblomastix strix]|uniref:Uncharacterized protein n=1 Tax=Streblomastix strix TaxID=222440 RepID=A0A5J4VFN7_9EUKA|nr:MAG: hypothetical protein EZS28_023072 [Streblomastix strix]